VSIEQGLYPVKVRLRADMESDPPPFSACIAQNSGGFLYPFYRDAGEPDTPAWMLCPKDGYKKSWDEVKTEFKVIAVFTAREKF
jgi:hypothetical protein